MQVGVQVEVGMWKSRYQWMQIGRYLESQVQILIGSQVGGAECREVGRQRYVGSEVV